jgi:hypothetical protein
MPRVVGEYLQLKNVEAEAPALIAEWDAWLDAQRDPGNYESYKERDQSVLPYIDGKPQWVTEVYMPVHILEKLEQIRAARRVEAAPHA